MQRPMSRRSAPPPPSHPSSGASSYADVSELDKYRLDSNIGKGSFGVISKVIRKSDGQEFAMKQIDYGKMTDKDKRQILAEVAILESLKHRNIVQLVQKIRDKQNERIFIIMEYCTSGDLGTLIRKAQRSKTPMHEDKIWNIFLQITLALNHCHWPNERTSEQNGKLGSRLSGAGEEGGSGRCQVLHRDLKPENVFMSDEFVKLGDFGLSKDMGTAAFTSTYVGTPLYMPPEILAENRYDTKSDIWSLGCLVFEMCMLSSPFAAATTQTELITMVRSSRYPEIPSHYSASLRNVIKTMLNLNPSRRPTTKDLLDLDEMKLHKKLFTVQNQTQLLNNRQEEVRRAERDLKRHMGEVASREEACVRHEADLQERERILQEQEAENKATSAKLDRAAEHLREQWAHYNRAKLDFEREVKAAEERFAAEAARTAVPARPPLEERATMPVASGSRQRAAPSTYEVTPTKIPLPPPPLSLRKHASKSLGNLAAIARGDIGPSQATGQMYPTLPGDLYSDPIELDRTPAKQVAGGGTTSIRSRKDRFGRNSIGSPGDLKKQYAQTYNYVSEDVTMASAHAYRLGTPGPAGSANSTGIDAADNSAMASPFVLRPGVVRPRKSSLVGPGGISGTLARQAGAGAIGGAQTPAEVLAQQRQQIQAPAPVSAPVSATRSSSSNGSAASRSSSAASAASCPSTATTIGHAQVQSTPAKWMPDDPDLPSPFLRRMPTAPAAVPTIPSAGGSDQVVSQMTRITRERAVLGSIPPPSQIPSAPSSAAGTADIGNGMAKISIRPKLSAPPGALGSIPRSKSGNLHQYAVSRAAGDERIGRAGTVQGNDRAAEAASLGYAARNRTVGRN